MPARAIRPVAAVRPARLRQPRLQIGPRMLNPPGMTGTVHQFDRLPQVQPSGLASAQRHVAPAREVPLVGVIRNQRSHRNLGRRPELPGRADMLIETPAMRSELHAILTRFSENHVDYLVVDGGDGTIRDVLTSGTAIFGDDWPPIVVLPAGKTNALALDLGIPRDWSLADALDAAESGNHALRQPMMITQSGNPEGLVKGFILGGGAFTEAISLGQDAHRRGAFNSLAVGLTAAWSLFSALFGSARNPLRKTTPMRLRDGSGAELPHSGVGDEAERFLLFASTLTRFPAGMQPFRSLDGKLRMTLIDNSRSGLLLHMPFIVRGQVDDRLRRKGCHRFGFDAFELDIANRFILDGESFPPGSYRVSLAPELRFVVP